ncbi:MAG: Sua5/YciO/YrdC/YwlC family protein, partial [Solobacterium sp.]|nr:Sua5/YciO/YrdC/YwlC family protein [Solobacterium sp.]
MKRYTNKEIKELAKLLIEDEVVSVPTDTVYGLCARYDHIKAQEKLRDIKHRPETKAFPIMCKDRKQIEEIAIVDEKANKIIASFMPGPITIVLNKKD